jgi:hypothetical protein
VPFGGKNQRVKDGACLSSLVSSDKSDLSDRSDSAMVYALKGNNTFEFYAYDIATNVWATKESIPAIGHSGKKKGVKKGSSMAALDGAIYVTKGNSTYDLWTYVPSTGGWRQLADIPTGLKPMKEGAGAAPVMINDTGYIYLMKGSGTHEFYRYSLLNNTWESRADLPTGVSGKPFKNGSCLAARADGARIYAIKGSYNEFSEYDVASNTWVARAPLPLVGSSGKKKKVKDGSGIAWYGDRLFAMKGGNTLEFYAWNPAIDSWKYRPDVPIGGGKRVKGGGGLTNASGLGLYATKGNNTVEFYHYGVASAYNSPLTASRSEILSQSAIRNPQPAIRLSPNPFSTATTASYSLPKPGNVSLKVYDVTGKVVMNLAAGYRDAGASRLHFDHLHLARGIYLLKLRTETGSATTSLIVQ